MQTKTLAVEALADRPAGTFLVNEIFYSLQGEGKLAGTPMVFVRFGECNLRCSLTNAGFNCDTEFASSTPRTVDEICAELVSLNPRKGWVLLTGGEPGLQVTTDLIAALHGAGWRIAIETNGTVALPPGIDWICVSPKSAEHTLRQRTADEVKYVRSVGMALPEPTIEARHYLISPAFEADGSIRRETLAWCIDLVKSAPERWALSLQYHKIVGMR